MTDERSRSALVTLSDVIYVLGRFLPARWLIAMAAVHGRLQYALRRDRAGVVRENLLDVPRVRSDGTAPDEASRRFFEGQQVRTMLLHLTQRMNAAEMRAVMPVEGLGHLDASMAAGQGSILLLSHLNSLSGFTAVVLLRRLGYDVRVAVPDERDPWAPSRFRQFLYGLEGSPPEGILESLGAFYCQFNIRPIIAALKENAIVAQTGDGWHSASFVDVDFLGRRVPFTNGVMNIARRTGAMVVPTWVVGRPPEVRLVLDPPFTVSDDAELASRVRAYAARLESLLEDHPETWEHFAVPNTLDTMAGLRERSLEERYRV